MGGKILVKPRELRGYAGRIRTKTQDAEAFIDSMERDIDRARDCFQGSTYDEYAIQFNSIKYEIRQKMNECLKSLADALVFAADEMERADREQAQKMSVSGGGSSNSAQGNTSNSFYTGAVNGVGYTKVPSLLPWQEMMNKVFGTREITNPITLGLGPISNWMANALNRGWGPITEEEYYRRIGRIPDCSTKRMDNLNQLDITDEAKTAKSMANAAKYGMAAYINNSITTGKITNLLPFGDGRTLDIVKQAETAIKTQQKVRVLTNASNMKSSMGVLKNVSAAGKVFSVAGKVVKVITPIIEYPNSRKAFEPYRSSDDPWYDKAIAEIGIAADAVGMGTARGVAKTVTLLKYIPGVHDQWADDYENWVDKNVNSIGVVEGVANLIDYVSGKKK